MAIEVIIGGIAIGGGGGGVGGPANTAVTSATAQTTALGLTEIQLASVTITPTSVDSKILLIGRLDVTKDAGVTVRTTTARIRRGTTNSDTQIGVDSKALSSAVATTTYGPGVIAYVDAPAVAVATTYTLRALCDAAAGSTANRWELNAIEVASKGADGTSGGGNVSAAGTPTSGQIAEWTSATTIQGIASTGTGNNVRATSPTLVTPALGTPTSGNLSNCSNIPLSGLTGLGTGVATFLGTPTSAALRAAITDETGTGPLVFGDDPILVRPVLGIPASGNLTNCTGFPVANLSGVIAVGQGGTGLNTIGTAGQIMKVNPGGTALIWAADDNSGGGGGVTDGDKGDITISGSGATYTIDAGVVTLAKMANLAQDQFIVRTTASTGVPQTATITAYGRSLVAAVDLAAARTILGLTTSTPGSAGDMLVYNGTITQYQTKAQVRENLGVTNLLVIPWVAVPANGDTHWIIRLNGTGTINSLTHRLVTGSITVNVKLNGTSITGLSAVAPTSTKATTNATAANTWADGDELTITFSGASTPGELGMNLNATRLT